MRKILSKFSHIKNNPSMFHKFLIPDIKPATKAYKIIHKLIFPVDSFKRKNLAMKYFQKYNQNLLDNKIGYLIKNLSKKDENIFKNLNKACQLLKKVNWEKEILNSKKKFFIEYPVDLSKKENLFLFNIIFNKNIYPTLINYFGQIPVLLSVSIWYSPNKKFEKNRSQEFHLDSDDTKQIKLLFPLESISNTDGPLTAINSTKTKEIFKSLNRVNCRKKFGFPIQNQKFSDEFILSFNPEIEKMTGDIGDCFFVDTSNCFHYGSRPSKKSKPRTMLSFHIVSSHARKLPLWTRKYRNINDFNMSEFSKKLNINKKETELFLIQYLSNLKNKFYTFGLNKYI